MKSVLRNILINIGALMAISHFLPSFVVSGGIKGWLSAAVGLMIANFLIVPFMKILLLPLNLLTLGLFSWAGNILALYALVITVPSITISTYQFPGEVLGGFTISKMTLNTFQVAAVASFFLAVIMHITHWLID